MLPRNYARHLDWGVLLCALGLAITGLVFIYTMSWIEGMRRPLLHYFIQQSVWLCIAAAAAYGVLALDYKLWTRVSWVVYLVNIALLVALLVIGRKTHGAGSWFSLGLMKFQPSEVTKIFFIITFAHFLARYTPELNRPWVLGMAVLQFAVPFGLIVLQPDMGTAVVYVAIFAGMLFVAGLDGVRIVIAGAVALSAAIVALPLALKGYQMERLLQFLHPTSDAAGSGWQLHQAHVAMGSGGVFGKGLFHGSQAALGFLPAAHTDFIFAAIVEQAGLAGGLAVLAMFLILLYRILRISLRAEDMFATCMGAGVFSMIAFQAVINLGMTVGFLPITGIPLPFVSYGGSSLITSFAATALVLNISVRRKKLMFS
jgi:rod shape determining protein RodA